MKVIIPVAGRGTRVRPHTFSKSKPFLPLAGKMAIDYVLDPVLKIKPEEIIIIHDVIAESEVKSIFPKRYPKIKFKFALQENPLGTAHAVYQAKEFINKGDDILIVYSDMIFFKDLKCINKLSKKSDGILFCIEVEDPQHYGVLYHGDYKITKIVEKPKKPKSNLANMGIYYFKDGHKFINHYIKKVLNAGINEKGEYFITDAFTFMLKDGKVLLAEKLDGLLDTGTVPKLIHANKFLLKGKVFKGKKVTIENSKIGENVSIGDNTTIVNCKIENSIIGNNTYLEGLTLKNSIIGSNNQIKVNGHTYNIGDNCTIN